MWNWGPKDKRPKEGTGENEDMIVETCPKAMKTENLQIPEGQ